MTLIIFILNFIFPHNLNAAVSIHHQNNYKYRAFYGECPTRSSNDLIIHVMKEIEKDHSLKDVKASFVTNKWKEKYFLSSYKIGFNPIKKSVKIQLECPKPLARVQVYHSNGKEHYSATLTHGGKLFDPAYETLLKNEKITKADLFSLVLPIELINKSEHLRIAKFLELIEPSLATRISEVIVTKTGSMTIIFSSLSKPTNVFLGQDLWEDKLVKLNKVIRFMDGANKRPSVINLTSLKKVVVKF